MRSLHMLGDRHHNDPEEAPSGTVITSPDLQDFSIELTNDDEPDMPPRWWICMNGVPQFIICENAQNREDLAEAMDNVNGFRRMLRDLYDLLCERDYGLLAMEKSK